MSSRVRSFDVNRKEMHSPGRPADRNPSRLTCRFLVVATLLLTVAGASGQPIGSRLDPNDFAPLGDLMMVTGMVTFDTDDLTVSGFVADGVLASSETGLVEMAVFTFTNISLTGDVDVQIIGSRPVAILSRSDIVIEVAVSVSGSPGEMTAGGAGGPAGGSGGTDAPGSGLGAGGADSDDAGAGGGYGGQGGDGGADDGDDTPTGGLTYSDFRLSELRGGSGGGGASFPPFAGQGGGGAGAVQFSALGEISLGRAILGTSDPCGSAEMIAGGGAFPFDNSAATTDGDPDPLCDFFDEDQIENDIWFCWTSTCTDNVTVQTCGGTAVDTRIAVYSGCTCPATAILACDDDSCDLQSLVTFAAVEGESYLIRVGTFPGEPGGPGTLIIDCPGGAGFDPGSISADGGNGSVDFSGWRAGGGGSGGSILLNAPSVFAGEGFLFARGGRGGNAGGPLSDSGGGGGGGRIAIYADVLSLDGGSIDGGDAGAGGDASGSPGEVGTLYIEPFFCPPPPPEFLYLPVPADGEIDTSVDVGLSWEDEGSPCWTEFDVFLDTQSPPQTLLCTNLAGTSCEASRLEPDTTYYWQLVVDRSGITFPGAVWSFTTGSCTPAAVPDGPAPTDGEVDVPVDVDLRWNFPFDPVGAPFVLEYAGHADTSDGSAFTNAQSAIGSQVPFVWFATPRTEDPTLLADWLDFAAGFGGPVVFLVPQQENWDQSSMADWAASIRDVLADFVNTGGTVIVADDGDAGNGVNFLSAAGLMTPGPHTGAGVTAESCTVIDSLSPIMTGLPPSFIALPGNTSINGAGNATALAERNNDGLPIVLSRQIGRGGVVLMGWNFQEFNADMARVIGNAVQWDVVGQGTCQTTYEVFFGTENPPSVQLCSATTDERCDPGILEFETDYYWQVVATVAGNPVVGPVWSFRTAPCRVPRTPRDPQPTDAETDVPANTQLTWELTVSIGCEPDEFIDGENISSSCPGVTLSTNGVGPVFAVESPAASTGTKVFGDTNVGGTDIWCEDDPLRVDFVDPVLSTSIDVIGDDPSDFCFLEAFDSGGVSIARTEAQLADGEVQTLTIDSPTEPIAYVLAGGFSGDCVELDNLVFPGPGDETYDVFLSSVSNPVPVLICDDITTTSCNPGPLDLLETYSWWVEVSNPCGLTVGPTWTFTTAPCTPPRRPKDPSPASGAVDLPIDLELNWNIYGTGGCDPNDFPHGTDISNACPGVTLSTNGTDPVFAVPVHSGPVSDAYGSGPTGPAPWCETQPLRADFAVAVDQVTLRVVADDDMDVGFLEAYDVGGALIGRVETVPLDLDGEERLMIVSATPTISYVMAGGVGSSCVLLDILTIPGEALTYDVFLGGDGISFGPVCQDIPQNTCMLATLDYDSFYFWRVTAKNACGETDRFWSFNTQSACLGQSLQGVDFVGLGDLSGGGVDGQAFAVSNDGLTVVGRGTSASGDEGAIWTFDGTDWNARGLGDLEGGAFQSIAFAISADGSTIVGQGTSASGSEALLARSVLGDGRCEPDDSPVGADISNTCPGLTLEAGGGGPVYSVTSLLASTGSRVFGNLPAGAGALIWCDAAPLRADLATPVNQVSVDIIGDGPFSVGFLEARNAAGALIARLETPPLGLGAVQTLTISSPTADIAFAVASGFNGTCVQLDNWRHSPLIGLGDLPGGAFASVAFGVSADGSTAVGQGTSALGPEAFVWRNGIMTPLGDLSGGAFDSAAVAVSADGSILVGHGTSAAGTEAVVWHFDGTNWIPEGLGDLPGGSFGSTAFAVSADGSTIVGQGVSASGTEAIRWSFTGGVWVAQGLGDLPTGPFFSQAFGVSADGSMVVGQSSTSTGRDAFVWDEVNGLQFVCFGQNPDVDPPGAFPLSCTQGPNNGSCWTVHQARGISADGRFIVGFGTNPNSEPEAWIADILSLCLAGDVNGDGQLTIDDVAAFVSVILDPAAATQAEQCAADVNQDGSWDGVDVGSFVSSLLP